MSIRMMLGAVALGLLTARHAGALCFVDPRPKTDYQALQELGEAVNVSRAVFSGEVIASTSARDTLRVERVWKGDLGTEVGIVKGEARHGEAMFAFSFAVGHRYLVFAHGKSNTELAASDCAGTTALTHAAPTIARLEQLEKALIRVSAGTSGDDELQLSARRFFEAVTKPDIELLVNATNVQARERVRSDLRNSRSRFSRILLTGSESVRARIRPIRGLPVVLLQHPDFVNRATACVVDRAELVPRMMRDVPAVHGSNGIVCIPFLRVSDGWIVSYEFAYSAWDPSANPGLRQSDASAQR